jgi:protein-disulfide isomerase-like protein with CxxC motif
MIGVMLPLFFIAMYEKDGRPAEKILRNYIRCKFYRHGRRPYQTENLYEIMAKGGNSIADESKKAAGASVGKRAPGKTKPRRR